MNMQRCSHQFLLLLLIGGASSLSARPAHADSTAEVTAQPESTPAEESSPANVFQPPRNAPEYDADSINYEPPAVERRGGFALALTLGYGAGEYHGYPLTVAALNDPNERQSTGFALANNISLWLGTSPRDWLSVGLGVSLMSVSGSETTGSSAGIVFHVEGYPLYALGGIFRDIGLGLDGGLGLSNLYDVADTKDQSQPIAESGALSTLGFSAFWEPWQIWHLSMGPALNYTHSFSQTMTINQLTLGFRTALYSVQPKKDKAQ